MPARARGASRMRTDITAHLTPTFDAAYNAPYANGEQRPSRAETDGPNCADYQKYIRGQGYDVKQGPNPDGDQFWIEHGTPFF